MELPDNWRRFRLGDVLERSNDTVMPRDLDEQRIGLVGLEDIEGGGTGVVRVIPTDTQSIDSLKTRFQTGDILYGKLRPYLNKVAIAPANGICSTEIWALKPKPLCDPRFAAFFLRSSMFVDRVASFTKGANLPRLDAASFDSVEIPLPPLSEQQQFVEILQEAEEIRRLRAEAEAKAAEIVPALFAEMFLQSPVRKKWELQPIENCVAERKSTIRTGPFGSDLLHSEFVEEGIPVLGIDNAVSNRFEWGERRYITEQKYRGFTRFRVFPGDVMVTIMGTVGRVAIAPQDLPESISSKHLCVITPDRQKIVPEYLWAALLHDPQVRAQTRAAGKGAIMEGWNSKIIRSLRIAIPPLELQQEFAKRLQMTQQLEVQADKPYDALTASLTANAFSGELTRPFRETHHKKLATEARQRDAALAASGMDIPRGRTAIQQELDSIFELPTDGPYAELSREQRDLFYRIRQMLGGISHLRYFTADSLTNYFDEGPLHRNPRAIAAHLAVFAVRGLVIPVSRQHPDNLQTGFALAYRLPVENLDDENNEPGDDCRQEMMDQQFRLATGDI